MPEKNNEQEKYTAELWTPRKHMVAKNGGETHDNKIRNCLQSLLNRYTTHYPEEFNRYANGKWLERKCFKILFPDKYARILELIEPRVKWTNDVNGRAQHGVLSHSAMKNAVQAVFA